MPETDLPVEVTSFVGRRAERGQIRSLLADSHLVTLTGFGGIGKTRLALRVASDLRRAFPDGVAFVPLDPHGDPDVLPHAVAGALGLEGRSTKAATAFLVEHLAPRTTLLILDNCEHLIDEVAVLTDTLLRTCPNLRVLATSREPLRVQGEAVHHVHPLSLPGRNALQESEAVQLFVDRARTVLGEFDITPANRDAVASIVAKLEGIPLALELAASRLRAMSVVELDQDLNDSWGLLSHGSRVAPDRQRTMRRCIDWSFNLCTPVEQQLWARLSVFSDGFEMDAAREVAHDVEDVVDVLLSLVDKSIVLPSSEGPFTRFRMLPPLRQRGLGELRDSGLYDELRLRHRDWCQRLIERVDREWMSERQLPGLYRLRRELGNIQTALDTCVAMPGQAEAGLAMGASALLFGLSDGFFRQGRYYFDRLLPLSPEHTQTRALALRTACWWSAMQGDVTAAAELLEEGREIAGHLGGHTAALLAQASAFVSMFSGELDAAAEQFATVIEQLEELGDLSQVAHSLTLTALTHGFRGDAEAALEAHERCLKLTAPTGETWYTSYALWIAGLATWVSGDVAQAIALEQESLRLKRTTRDRLGTGASIEALAWFNADTDPERSARLLGAAEAIWKRIDSSTAALPALHLLHTSCLEKLTKQLGRERLDELVAAGLGLDVSAALDLALLERSTPPRPRRQMEDSPLTRREQEIAGLVATGLSNREIAAQLVISKRTAETHVEHILTKLGYNNRGQIAAWVSERAAR